MKIQNYNKKPLSEYLIEENELHGGVQKRFMFENCQGASVIKHDGSYGSENGLWELAVTDGAGDLDYSTEITSDVLPRLTWNEVYATLRRIQSL